MAAPLQWLGQYAQLTVKQGLRWLASGPPGTRSEWAQQHGAEWNSAEPPVPFSPGLIGLLAIDDRRRIAAEIELLRGKI